MNIHQLFLVGKKLYYEGDNLSVSLGLEKCFSFLWRTLF
jgi:hypothetical protein